jgi:hypothetical protein
MGRLNWDGPFYYQPVAEFPRKHWPDQPTQITQMTYQQKILNFDFKLPIAYCEFRMLNILNSESGIRNFYYENIQRSYHIP